MAEKIGYFIGREYADPLDERFIVRDTTESGTTKYPGMHHYIEVYRLGETDNFKKYVEDHDGNIRGIVQVGKRIGKMSLNGIEPTLEEIPGLINQTIRLSRKNVVWSEAYKIVNGKPSEKEKVCS